MASEESRVVPWMQATCDHHAEQRFECEFLQVRPLVLQRVYPSRHDQLGHNIRSCRFVGRDVPDVVSTVIRIWDAVSRDMDADVRATVVRHTLCDLRNCLRKHCTADPVPDGLQGTGAYVHPDNFASVVHAYVDGALVASVQHGCEGENGLVQLRHTLLELYRLALPAQIHESHLISQQPMGIKWFRTSSELVPNHSHAHHDTGTDTCSRTIRNDSGHHGSHRRQIPSADRAEDTHDGVEDDVPARLPVLAVGEEVDGVDGER